MNWHFNSVAVAAALLSVASCGNSVDGPEGTKTLQTDGIRITWIQDNAKERLMERSLFPDASDSLVAGLGLQDGVPSTVSVFLVETDGKKMLFDTGLGLPDSRMLPSLQALGVAPEDIDYLYLTHFHGDHIGGMLKDGKPVFTNAKVYASKKEYDAWMAMSDDRKAQVEETMAAYQDRLHLFTAGDTLPGNVLSIDAPGHTPGHTVYRVGDFLIVGDLMHGVALQMEHPEISASYDMDFPSAVSARKEVLKYASDSSLTMAGMHFPAPAFIQAGK